MLFVVKAHVVRSVPCTLGMGVSSPDVHGVWMIFGLFGLEMLNWVYLGNIPRLEDPL